MAGRRQRSTAFPGRALPERKGPARLAFAPFSFRIHQGEAGGNNGIYRGIKSQSDVRPRNWEVALRPVGFAIVPIDHSVAFGVNRSFQYRRWHRTAKRLQEITGATTGVAVGKHLPAVFRQYPISNHLRGAQNAAMGYGTAKRGTQSSHRSDICWPLSGNCTPDNPSQTVAY